MFLSLSMMASTYGDGSVLRTHLAGLRRLVAIKADYHVFLDLKITAKIDRPDLSAYICNGSRLSPPIGTFAKKPPHTQASKNEQSRVASQLQYLSGHYPC
jgi:hypothetical protein